MASLSVNAPPALGASVSSSRDLGLSPYQPYRAPSPDASGDSLDISTLTDAELAALVEKTQHRVAVLKGEEERRDKTIETLKRGLRDTVDATEREEERLSNAMMKRVQALRTEHTSLLAHLHDEEVMVGKLEGKLSSVAEENKALETTLLTEEEEIVQRLRAQIDAIERQKKELEAKLTLEAGDVAHHVERIRATTVAAAAAPADDGAAVANAGRPPVMPAARMPGKLSALAPPSGAERESDSASSTPASRSAVVTPSLGGSVASQSPAHAAAGFGPGSPPPSANSSIAHFTSPGPLHSLGSGSQTHQAQQPQQSDHKHVDPAASQSNSLFSSQRIPTPIIAAPAIPRRSPHGNLASDRSMLRLLQQEIDRVKDLESDITDRSLTYRQRIANLEGRVDKAKLEWERQRAQADKLRQELSRTRSLTKELVANHELLAEWQAERELNTSRSNSVTNTAQSTPRIAPSMPTHTGGGLPSPGASFASGRGRGQIPPLATTPAEKPAPLALATPAGQRSASVASDHGAASSISHSLHGDETPLQPGRGISAYDAPPTVLHGGTPMGSARRQFANGSACIDRIDRVDAAEL